jgi:single-strand DNA-binding protein
MVNKWIGIGRLGKDPEVRYLTNGTAVANFSLACDHKWKDKKETFWGNIVVYGKIAEICGQYISKGSTVYLEGRLTERKWKNDAGQERSKVEIIADTVKFLDKKSGTDDGRITHNHDEIPEEITDLEPF